MGNELKVGDIIFEDSYFNGLKKRTIIRETATTFVLDDNTKVDKPFNNCCYAKGNKSGWGHKTMYVLIDDVLIAKYNRQNQDRYISKIQWHKLSDKHTESIVNFIKALL